MISFLALDPKQNTFMTRERNFNIKEVSSTAIKHPRRLSSTSYSNKKSLGPRSNLTTKIMTEESVLGNSTNLNDSAKPIINHYENVLVTAKRRQNAKGRNSEISSMQKCSTSIWSIFKICSNESTSKH